MTQLGSDLYCGYQDKMGRNEGVPAAPILLPSLRNYTARTLTQSLGFKEISLRNTLAKIAWRILQVYATFFASKGDDAIRGISPMELSLGFKPRAT